MLWEWVWKKVYKALIGLARGALSIALLMSVSEAFSVPFLTLIKLCYTKVLEWSSLVPRPEAKSSLEIMNPTLFTVSYQNQIDYTLFRQRWRSSILSAKIRPGADCSSDHELLISKFRLKLKKVGKNTRPSRYDLNQNPYDFTAEMTKISGTQIAWKTMDRGLWHCAAGSDQDYPQEK